MLTKNISTSTNRRKIGSSDISKWMTQLYKFGTSISIKDKKLSPLLLPTEVSKDRIFLYSTMEKSFSRT